MSRMHAYSLQRAPLRTTRKADRFVGDRLDVPLEDAVLMEEVELISTLMIAASEADERLDPQRIDQLLGVRAPAIPEQKDKRGS